MAENTTAGAAMMVPHDIPRATRKRKLVRDRVRASKRRSRYSYAVNTLAPWRNGTSVTPRMTMTQSSARMTGRLSGVAGLEQPEKQQRRHLHCHHAKQRAAEESRAMVKWRGAGHVKWQED